MTTRNDDPPRDLSPDHPQRLLIMAYTRLMLLPKRPDGTRTTWITTAGNCELRLLEMPLPEEADACSLCVELFDRAVGRVVDSRSCRDLNDAGAATECFLALARELHTQIATCYFDPVRGQFVEIPLGGKGPLHRG